MSFLGDLVGGAVSLAKNFFGGSSDSGGSGSDYRGSYSTSTATSSTVILAKIMDSISL